MDWDYIVEVLGLEPFAIVWVCLGRIDLDGNVLIVPSAIDDSTDILKYF